MNPELDEKLSALLDGELTPAEAEALRAELARSPELAARLAALAAVDDGLRALPGSRVPSDLRARVERQLRTETRLHAGARRAPLRARRHWLVAAFVAAAAAAVLALLLLPQLRHDDAQLARIEPAPEDVALADDLPVIEVLDVLAELDELEEVGSG